MTSAFYLIISQNTGAFEKYVQTLVKRISSEFVKKFSSSPCIFNSSWFVKIGEVLLVLELLLII